MQGAREKRLISNSDLVVESSRGANFAQFFK